MRLDGLAASTPRSVWTRSAHASVSSIVQAILSELERVRGAKIVVTLDIDAEAANGFPEDVESVVRDNARDLRLADFGFESE